MNKLEPIPCAFCNALPETQSKCHGMGCYADEYYCPNCHILLKDGYTESSLYRWNTFMEKANLDRQKLKDDIDDLKKSVEHL